MKLAYSTNAYTHTDLPDAIRRVAALGFEGVELLCDEPHWFPGRVTAQEVDEVCGILTQTGLQVSNLNANTANGYYRPMPPENVFEPSLTHPDPQLRRWREGYTLAALELARALGAPCVSVTSGRPRAACEPALALDFLVTSLRRICRAADETGVRVGIEYEPGLLVERACEVHEVIERVGSAALGVNLDIGHSFLMQESPAATVELLAGRIWNVHVEDIRDGKHFHRVPGDGELPFDEYLRALGQQGYNGFLTVELYSYPDRPDDVGRRSLAYLRSALAGQ